MKRQLGILMLLVLTVGWAVAGLSDPTITVLHPDATDAWTKGESYPIQWSLTGLMPDTVRISLRNEASTSEVLPIISSIGNNGHFDWTIPSDVPNGRYVIRVKAVGANVHGDSKAFIIHGPHKILILSPQENDAWEMGSTHVISWVTEGTGFVATAQIALRNLNDHKVTTIIEATPNTGTCSWTVEGVAIGNYEMFVYAMYSENVDGSVYTNGLHSGPIKMRIAAPKPTTPVPIKK